jgi:hypothetical protein
MARKALVVALVAVSACGGIPSADPPAGSEAKPAAPPAQAALISDEGHPPGKTGFFWLPPLVPAAPAVVGSFARNVGPEIHVSLQTAPGSFTPVAALGGAQVTMLTACGGQPVNTCPRYQATWSAAGATAGSIYRLSTLVGRSGAATVLGTLDVQVVASAAEAASVDRAQYAPLVAGSSLPIAVRIDRPAVDQDGDNVFDWNDNCPTVANGSQADSVGNGIGDACRCLTVVCTALDVCHAVGVCNKTTGLCSNPNAPGGTSCDDGNPCTRTDVCQSGTCRGTNPLPCTALDNCHVAGTCNPATGQCSNPAKAEGANCNDGDSCTKTDTCRAGVCTGANPVVCKASDRCHVPGTCDPATGACSNPPKVCAPSDQCHDPGVCSLATGACSNPPKENGAACDDGNLCTTTDACIAGVCFSGSPVVCGVCQNACDPSTGQCPSRPEGTSCADGNACNGEEQCRGGACRAATPWAAEGNLVTARRYHTATLLQDGTVLVVGGIAGVTDILNGAEIYDPTMRTSRGVSPMGTRRLRHTATLLPDGRVLVAGGSNGDSGTTSYLDSVEIYNPLTNAWAPAPPMPRERMDHTATLLPDAGVLVAGGISGKPMRDISRYDIALGQWTQMQPMASERFRHTATLFEDGVVFLGGSRAPHQWELWTDHSLPLSIPALTSRVEGHTSTRLSGGSVLTAGGIDKSMIGALQEAELLVPGSHAPRAVGPMLAARWGHTASLMPDGRVLIAGGTGFQSVYLPSAEIYDPATERFRHAGDLAQPRVAHAAIALPDGRVLVMGGFGSNGQDLASVETLAGGLPLDCDDGNPCTAETCEPAAGCGHAPVADSTSCTVPANGADGLCMAGVCLQASCDDGDPCTTDSWEPAFGACRYIPADYNIGFPDADFDGYGTGDTQVRSCDPGVPQVSPVSGDCNDADPSVNPGAQDPCNGADLNCNGRWDITFPGTCSSLQQALAVAVSARVTNGLIRVQPGQYWGPFVFGGASVELRGTGGAAATVLTNPTSVESAVVLLRDGEGPSTVIDGFTITGGLGHSASADWVEGGGIYVNAASPTLRNLVVRDNRANRMGAGFGGGIQLRSSAARLSNVLVADNVASYYGGGLSLYQAHGAVLENVRVVQNRASYGGGLAAYASSPVRITNGIFSKNDGAAGGAIMVQYGSMEVINASLVDNVANGGAGLYLLGTNVQLLNVTMSGGVFRHEGGAIMLVDGSAPIVSFSNFFGNAAPEFVGMGSPVGTAGNIAVDPTFVQKSASDATTWNLRLAPGSPLIDAGDPALADPDGSRSDIGAFGGPGAPP